MREDEQVARFEQAVLPHLDAAYNLARWLTRRDHDAEDLVQEACLRAYRSFARFHGTDGRAWFLAIVRNACYTWLEQARARGAATSFDEDQHSGAGSGVAPDSLLLQEEGKELLHQALDALPPEHREVIVLRELEGLSYKEIAGITEVPLGTVMSRLARARERLQHGLDERLNRGT